MLEHRWITDVGPGLDVHHRNEIRTDNAPANLAGLAHDDHSRFHATVPIETLVALHEAGMTTVEIGRAVGLHHSGVSRRVRAAGREIGPRSMNRKTVDVAGVIRRHEAGERATPIGRSLGVSKEVVLRVLREAGIEPHRPGRPRLGNAG